MRIFHDFHWFPIKGQQNIDFLAEVCNNIWLDDNMVSREALRIINASGRFMNLKRLFLRVSSIAIATLLAVSTAGAEIYRYIDKDGVWHFTNVPSSPKYRLYRSYELGIKFSTYSTDKYDHIIEEASKKYKVSFPLVKAIIKAESSFNPRARSRKGAMGLMQLMPATQRLLKVYNPYDPEENIMGGTRYFKYLLNRFKGKLQYALAGYNAGPNQVVAHNGIPPFRETKNYVVKVMRYYKEYKQ